MTKEQNKALFIFSAGFILFWFLKPKLNKNKPSNIRLSNEEDNPKDRKKMDVPTITATDTAKNPLAKNAFASLKAYISAYNNSEPQSVLDELNREFAKEFKVKVYRRKSDNKLVVCDLDGKEIMVNN